MSKIFDLSDNPTLGELEKQIRNRANKKLKEAETVKNPLNAGKQWNYGYYTACQDILRGITQVKGEE